MLFRRCFLSGLLALAAASCGAAEKDPYRGLDGQLYRPFGGKETKAVVVLFLGHVCPISNTLAPEIGRIHEAYRERGVAVFGTYPDPELSADAARKHAASFGFRFPILLDSDRRLVRKAGATVTPEAAVFTPEGKRLYHGRINDLYADLGRKRPTATTHDLRSALDAVLAGKPVPQSHARAIGCYIPEPRR